MRTSKRWLSAAVLLLCTALPYAGLAASFPNGDINGDGKVNITDSLLILRSSVGLRQTTLEELARADLNQDGKITVSDAVGTLGIAVGTKPPMDALISYPDCLGPAYIYAAKDASITKAQITARPSVTYAPGNLLSASGFFKKSDPRPPAVTYGPFAVAAGGKLRAHIVGTPPVPAEWSLGNWNSALRVYYERYYSGTYTSSEEILTLAGQTKDNDLTGEAEWPTAGRLTFVVTPPAGYGALFGGMWDQSYTVTVDVLELRPSSPAQAGMRLELGDRLTTTMWNPALLSGQFGSLAQIGESSEVSVTAGDTIGLQPPPGLTTEPYEVQLARKLLELWLSGYPLPGALEELMQQVFMDEGAFESNARRFLGSEFTSGKLYEALQMLNTEKDLYEAAVQVKLLLDGSKEKWTVSKLASALWEVKSPDGMDLLEWVVRLSGHAAEAASVIGWAAAAMDAAQAVSLVREHYAAANTAATQYGEASQLFSASRSWSDAQMAEAISNLQQSIADTEERIRINRAKLEFDLQNLAQKLKADMANGPVDRLPYEISAKKIAHASSSELAQLLVKIGGDRLKLEVLQKYRQGKPKHSGAKLQQVQAASRPTRLVLASGAVQVLGGGRQDLQVEVLGHSAASSEGEFLCRRSGDSGYIGCISGEVLVRTPAGDIVKLTAGKKLSVLAGQVEEFDPSKDALKPFEGLPLRDIITGIGRPAPYTDGPVPFTEGGLPEGWIWQDPNKDALLEFPETGTLRITVPDGNDLWGARLDAPRLLRKVTGDFNFEADIKLQTAATNGASTEWLLFSPASYEGARAKQMGMDVNSLAPHYRLFGGGILRWEGNTTFAGHQDFVRFRLTRRGDVWKSYWSLDGRVWHMSARETILLPDTLWVGWAFKRQAWDRMYEEKAVTTIRNVRLRTAPPGTLPVDEWDFETAEGASVAVEGKVVKIALDGTKLCSVNVHSGRTHDGDFDNVVRFSAKPWTYQAGQSYQFAISAKSASNDKTLAYIRRREFEDYAPSRYDTDMQINGGWGRYQWVSANDFSGYLRIARRQGKITTYYWGDRRWDPLGEFADNIPDPMYLSIWMNNTERASKPAPLSAEFEVVSDVDGAPMSAWEPEDINLPVLPPPTDLALLPGTTAKLIQAPYPLGNLFFTSAGLGFVFSSELEWNRQGSRVDRRGSLLMVAADGVARTYVRSDLLCGLNRKSGAAYDGAFLIGVDYWPDGGNRYGGLFRMELDGSFSEITLKEGHGGFSDLIPALDNGWYFVDFENDNLWRLPKIDEPETRVITSGEVPYGLGVVAQDPATGVVYCVNWKGSGGWPFGGENAIYKIVDGKAVLVVKAPEGQGFAGLDFARGGSFGSSLYASTDKQIVRVEPDGALTPVVSGGETMGAMRFNPATGDLLVVYGEKQLLLVFSRE
ncbi:MAG: dockerin type I domain-containing protein [Armatimonadota bacterium]